LFGFFCSLLDLQLGVALVTHVFLAVAEVSLSVKYFFNHWTLKVDILNRSEVVGVVAPPHEKLPMKP
jgi:hypothetical protein